MAAFAPMVGKHLGVKKVPIKYSINGKTRSVEIPDIMHLAVEPLPSAHPSGETWAVRLAIRLRPTSSRPAGAARAIGLPITVCAGTIPAGTAITPQSAGRINRHSGLSSAHSERGTCPTGRLTRPAAARPLDCRRLRCSGIAVLAWLWLWREWAAMVLRHFYAGHGNAKRGDGRRCRTQWRTWRARRVMWFPAMIAMMLPSVTPMIMLTADLRGARARGKRSWRRPRFSRARTRPFGAVSRRLRL